jgi:hypothetical protein
MMATFDVNLDPTNPYVATPIYSKGGKIFFGIWVPPPVQIDGDEKQVVIQQGLDGQLDLIADAEYGDRRLWRVVAQANKIDLPLRDLVPGMKIIVPKAANVYAALQIQAQRAGAIS